MFVLHVLVVTKIPVHASCRHNRAVPSQASEVLVCNAMKHTVVQFLYVALLSIVLASTELDLDGLPPLDEVLQELQLQRYEQQ